MTGNRITNNTVIGGVIGIGVYSGVTREGTTSDTTVSGNTISGTTFTGIEIASHTGSSIDGTQVTDNIIRDSEGRALLLSRVPFLQVPRGTRASPTPPFRVMKFLRSESTWTGVVVRFFANNSTITHLRILENHAFDNGAMGFRSRAGAVARQATRWRPRSPGIPCPGMVPASGYRVGIIISVSARSHSLRLRRTT